MTYRKRNISERKLCQNYDHLDSRNCRLVSIVNGRVLYWNYQRTSHGEPEGVNVWNRWGEFLYTVPLSENIPRECFLEVG